MKIKVRVTPNSKVEGIVDEGDMFLIRVKEPAKEGKANRAVIKLLADFFGVPQSQVTVSSGFNNRIKVIDIVQFK